MKYVPEILAPAGNSEMALAAYEAGADAVYLGCGNFNARRRAANFTIEELGALVNYAHKNGKKTYVTVNTLIKEKELADAAELLYGIAATEADAIIVQDPGILQIARKYFPMLECHASTQMGLHNVSGILQAAAWGCKRVILERQISMQEIKVCAEAARKAGIDLEVFIHGSMCASLSGRCLWSAALGGESGNRGCCKQPCRREYLFSSSGKKTETAHWLSMHDMAGSIFMDDMISCGIKSFKIEGRLRSPDYVSKVTAAYVFLRDHLISAKTAAEKAEALAECEAMLARTPSRCPGPGPALEKNDCWLKPFETGAFGTETGIVKAVTARGIAVKLYSRLHLGDRIRLVPPGGGEGESFTVTRLFRKSRTGDEEVKGLASGEAFIPGNFKMICRVNSTLRKIGESNSAYRRRACTLPAWTTRLPAVISCTEEKIILEIPERDISISIPHQASEARNHALSPAMLKETFSAGSPPPWQVIPEISCCAENLFIPASTLKQLRRNLFEMLAGHLADAPRNPEAARGLQNFLSRPQHTCSAKPLHAVPGYRIPAFVPAGEEKKLFNTLRAFLHSNPAASVAAGSWAGIHWLASLRQEFPEALFIIQPPAPVTNSMTAELLAESGINGCETWQELETSAHEDIAANAPIPVAPAKRIPPLLVTRAKLAPGIITDRNGERFRIAPVPGEPLNGIYAMDKNPVTVWKKGELK